MMVAFQTSLKDDPDHNARPYYVTLALVAMRQNSRRWRRGFLRRRRRAVAVLFLQGISDTMLLRRAQPLRRRRTRR
jgi:hypothetical protein